MRHTMHNRRQFIQMSSIALATLGSTLLTGCGGGGGGGGATAPTASASGSTTHGGSSSVTWTMRDEADPHAATWMAFTGSSALWATDLPDVQQTLARIANAIVAYEPVKMLVRPADKARAAQLCDARVTLLETEFDDLWVRDTGGVFVIGRNGEKGAVDFNFNGWGNKQAHGNDKKVASFMASQTGATRLTTSLVLEGGAIEVDGKGTAIITESCVLNSNRNPGVSKAACEAELKRLLGIHKVIWLPGIAGRDITDGHTDFYARFTSPGVVVAGYDGDPASYDHTVTQQHLAILRAATDASGKALTVHVLNAPTTHRRPANKDFAAGYINFYVCNRAVIMPQFGDVAADAAALSKLQELYPGRTVVQLDIDPIAAGGGGIHCTTQQEPRY